MKRTPTTLIIAAINIAEIAFMHSMSSLLLWLGYFVYVVFRDDL